MGYGRLDVFWPDGKFESFSLTTPSASVGRSSGCTIVLDTDTISRYHFSITLENEAVQLTDLDSANGTFIDGMRLESNTARLLHGGEEIQIGHLRMIFHRLDENVTVPISEVAEDTQRIRRQDFGFSIEVYEPDIPIPPGSHATMEISIYNNSNEDKRFWIDVLGLPEGWAKVNRPQVEVSANDSAPVLVNIKPLRQSDSVPGDYPVTIAVSQKDDADKRIEVDVSVQILSYSGFGMALAIQSIIPHEPFRLHVHNQGSAPLPIYVMGRSEEESLKFTIPRPQVLLGPGERQVVQGDISPQRKRWFGRSKDHWFDLMVRSQDDAGFLASVRGYYIDTPILPAWAATLLGIGAIAALGLIGLALILILNASPPPEIVDFTIQPTLVERGQPVALNWAVNNADGVEISVDGTPLNLQPPADAISFEIDTNAYNGDVVINLTAFNGDRSVNSPLSITIYAPMSVDYFEVAPEQLVRHVVNDLNVRWNVNNAITTHVRGLESLGPVVVEPSYGPEGDFNISGIASDNFTVTLVGEDEHGNVLEQSINIDLLNPECTTVTEEFRLYDAPDTTANVIGTHPADTVLVVDGRDETGSWLRTQLPGGVPGWGARTDLVCSDLFSPDALRIQVSPVALPEVSSPPLVPTLTPTSEPP